MATGPRSPGRRQRAAGPRRMADFPRPAPPLVPLVRTPRRSLPRRSAGHPAGGLLRVPVGLLRRPAAVHPRHDAVHGGDRRVRGAAVRDAGAHRGLAVRRRPRRPVDRASRLAAAARRRARRQRGAGSAADHPQAPGAGRELPHAAAVELPPADARPEHELLPGRVRRARRDQGHADRARGARQLVHGGRHPRVHHHLFRDHGGRGRHVRRRPTRARS